VGSSVWVVGFVFFFLFKKKEKDRALALQKERKLLQKVITLITKEIKKWNK